MAVYVARSCPMCRSYFGIVIGEPKSENNVQPIRGRLVWIRSHLDALSRLWLNQPSIKTHQVLCSSRRSSYGNYETLHPASEADHGELLRTEPIIDPFLCLLKEALFSFGFCCESIDCSSHNESPKHPAFGIFNSSSCAPVKSGGTSLYCESDSVPAIPVHFFHRNPVWTGVYRSARFL